jgi:hypothetical protein
MFSRRRAAIVVCAAVAVALTSSSGVALGAAQGRSAQPAHGRASWAVVTSPNAGVRHGDGLEGIACVKEDSCMAVGYYQPGRARRAGTVA